MKSSLAAVFIALATAFGGMIIPSIGYATPVAEYTAPSSSNIKIGTTLAHHCCGCHCHCCGEQQA